MKEAVHFVDLVENLVGLTMDKFVLLFASQEGHTMVVINNATNVMPNKGINLSVLDDKWTQYIPCYQNVEETRDWLILVFGKICIQR